MNTLLRAVLATALTCVLAPAQAGSNYRAQFQLDAFPQLQTGTAFDHPGMLDGAWQGLGLLWTQADTREQVGTTVDPDTGATVPIWNGANDTNRDYASGQISFGRGYSVILAPSPFTQTGASASLGGTFLGATAELRELPAKAWSRATWTRDFWIDPGVSFTFGGIAQLALEGDAPPLQTAASFLPGDNDASGRLAFADAQGRARVEIGATFGQLAAGSGIVDTTLGPDGFISMTIANTGTERLFGNLFAGAFVNASQGLMAAPVPEPATALLVCAGAMLVGARARRSR